MKRAKLKGETEYVNSKKAWSAKLIARVKHRAKTKGLAFDLTTEWLRDNNPNDQCHVTGIFFQSDYWEEGALEPWCPTIDRKDPLKGYTQDNCQLVVAIYNAAKRNWTDGDVRLLANALLSTELVLNVHL
jgi:hypothetical protein